MPDLVALRQMLYMCVGVAKNLAALVHRTFGWGQRGCYSVYLLCYCYLLSCVIALDTRSGVVLGDSRN